MLNYDDTEEQIPAFEDPEVLPLVRRTVKDLKQELGMDNL